MNKTNVSPQLSAEELADILGKVVDDYLERLNRGESPQAAEYIAQHPECASTIRQAVRALEFMEHSLTPSRDFSMDPAWRPSRQLGDFEILSEIGRGGMGIVYEAQQLSMGGRKVALKVLPFATMVEPKRLQRFHNEVRAVASLDHPHIVAIYAVGEERGVHYFAMQLVRGQSMAAVIHQVKIMRAQRRDSSIIELISQLSQSEPNLQCDTAQDMIPEVALHTESTARSCNPDHIEEQEADKNKDSTSRTDLESNTQPAFHPRTSKSAVSNHFCRSVAEIGVQAAEALAHAHQQGIVHRDIKPANLMLDGACKVYLTDFGLAQMEQETGLTMTGDLIGTLRYMAPEQASGKRVPIDHRVDIYALGASLYEMLTTLPAFKGENRAELLKQISFEEPKSLRKIAPSIPVDLETVINKAMAKNPTERYLTAQEFADDLKRYLAIQPLLARRTSIVRRGMKWTARHQEITWSAIAALSLITLLTSFSAWYVTGKNQQLFRINNNLQTQTALAMQFEKETRQAQAQTQKEKQTVVAERNRALENLYLADMRQAARYFEGGKFEQLIGVLEKYVPEKNENDLRRWEWYYFLSKCFAADKVISGHTRGVFDVKWDSEGTKLATAGADNTVRIWDLETSQQLLLTRPRSWGVQAIDWSPDSKQIIIGGVGGTHDKPGGNVLIWDLNQNAEPKLDYSGTHPIGDVAWSPDGRYYSFGEETVPAAFTAWDTVGKRQAARDSLEGEGLKVIAWSHGGTWVALAAGQRIVKWDIEQRKELAGWKAHEAGIAALQVSYDNRQIASGSFDGWLKIWNVDSNDEFLSINVNSSISSLDWSNDNSYLVVGTRGQTIQIFDGRSGNQVESLHGHTGPITAVDWHPSKLLIASASLDRTARIWDVSAIARNEGEAASSNAGSSDVVLSLGPYNAIWRKVSEGTDLEICAPNTDSPVIEVALESIDEAAFDADWDSAGRVVFPNGRQVEVWDINLIPRKLCAFSGHSGDVHNVQFSHDARLVASSSVDGTVRIWNLASQVIEKTLVGHQADHFVSGIAWSPDDTRIAAGGWDRTIRIWDVDSGLEACVLRGHSEAVMDVAWSPDGDRIASRQMIDRSIKLWDAGSGEELLSLHFKDGVSGPFYWSEDGKQLIAGEDVFDSSKGYTALESKAFAIGTAWRNFDRAMGLANSGRFDEAEAAWAKALSSNPALAESEGDMDRMASAARFQFGFLLTQKQDHRHAIEVYQEAIEKFPDDSFAYFGMGESLFALGNYDKVIEFVLAGALVDPSANPFRNFAERFNAIGDYPRALLCYERAYKMRPDRFENINNLAWFLATCPDNDLRDAPRAVELSKEAIDKTPDTAGFGNTLGIAHYRNGDYAASVNAIQKSIIAKSTADNQVNPDGYDLLFLAMAQMRLGKQELAISNLDRAIAWIKRFALDDAELQRFQDEAVRLIKGDH